jgi:hypothetical protein
LKQEILQPRKIQYDGDIGKSANLPDLEILQGIDPLDCREIPSPTELDAERPELAQSRQEPRC